MRGRTALQQLSYLGRDLSAIVNRRGYRWLTLWLTYSSAPALIRYRISRAVYLLVGGSFPIVRVFLWPLFFLLRLLGPVADIRVQADIGPGLRILHPAMGALVSPKAVCGRGLILTGGNWIVLRNRARPGVIRIGNDVELRANAVVLGPVSIGDNSIIGAGAVVVNDCPPGSILVGAPARPLAAGDPDAVEVEPREELVAASV